jgi:GNAT superfamily N-acetyltransferase
VAAIKVRPAEAGDAAEIVYLGALMYKSVGAKPTPAWALESTTLVKERLGKDLYGVVIDAEEGGLAACALVNIGPRLPRPGRNAHRTGYVQWVSTAPQYHRRGYAREVMLALLEWTDQQGIEVIELHATPDARELYRELGFFVKADNISMMALRGDAQADALRSRGLSS